MKKFDSKIKITKNNYTLGIVDFPAVESSSDSKIDDLNFLKILIKCQLFRSFICRASNGDSFTLVKLDCGKVERIY